MGIGQAGKKFFDTLNGRARIDQTGDKFVITKGNIDVALFGFDAKNNVVLKVAKDGIDVNKASDDQLIFNSAQNVFKIVNTGTYFDSTSRSFPSSAGLFTGTAFTIATIPHNLGYTPAVIAYYKAGTEYVPMPYSDYFQVGTSNCLFYTYSVTADSKNVYVKVNAMSYGTNFFLIGINLKYFLLQESAV